MSAARNSQRNQDNEFHPLTHIQRDIWVDQLSAPGIPLYNIGGYLIIRGPLDAEKMHRAVQRLTRESDAFSIRLSPPGEAKDEYPRQHFAASSSDEYLYRDFSHSEDSEQTAMAWIQAGISKPFELYDVPLYRFRLARVREDLHYFLQCQHHLISDGISNVLISQRLATAYNRLDSQDSNSTINPSYIKAIKDDQAYFESAAFEKNRAFWQKTYASIPPNIVAHPEKQGDWERQLQSGLRIFLLQGEDWRYLQSFAVRHKFSMFHLILAALAIYYGKAASQYDMVFGAALMNRRGAAAKNTVGLFTSMCPCRFELDPSWTLAELVAHIATTLATYYRHQRLPLSEVNKTLGLTASPLFELVVSYEQFDFDVNFAEARGEMITLANGYQANALAVAVKEYHRSKGLEFSISWNRNAFDEPEIELLFERLCFVLAQMRQDGDRPIAQLEVVPPQELALLRTWSENERPRSSEDTFLDLFLERVTREPRAIALQQGSRRMDYAELDEQSRRLAAALVGRGILAGQRVGVFLPRGVDWIVAMLGIMRMRGVYVAMDTNYPAERIAHILTGSRAVCLICQRGDENLPAELPTARLDMQELLAGTDSGDYRPPGRQDPAYSIFTSGSTGVPKGVLLHHRGLHNLIVAQMRIFRIEPDSRILQFASSGFDASISEVMTAICSGAALVFADGEAMQPGPNLTATLRREHISHVTLPPSSLAVMPDEALPDLQVLVVAGEPCPLNLAQAWSRGRCFINAYGPTETSVCASTWEYRQDAPRMLIGRPMDNMRLLVLNRNGEPAPANVFGELHIGGAGIGMGYLHNPAKTAAAFVPDPWSEQPGGCLYRSGDRARWTLQGELELAGRHDRQIKLRGYRIEPGEIENRLNLHPAIRQSVVALHHPDGDQGNGVLMAWYLADSQDAAPDDEVLLDFLAGSLPYYMLPSRFIQVEAFPRTANGKIDLAQLPIPVASDEKAGLADSVTKLQLLAIWSELLPGLSIALDDNLFEKGLDSLSVIQWLAKVEKHFGVALHPADMYQLKTLGRLADHLEEKNARPLSTVIVPIKPQGNLPPLFCVTAGYGDVLALNRFAAYLHPDRPFYVLQPPSRDQQDLDIGSLAAIYLRHIRSIQLQAPFHLAGYSAGGLLAYEMARQLEAEGEQVSSVMMMGAPYLRPLFGRRVHERLMRYLPRLLPSKRSVRFSWLRILQSLFDDAGLKTHLDCIFDYTPGPYSGKLTVFEGRHASTRMHRWRDEWRGLCSGGLEVVYLPGNHDSFIRPPYHERFVSQLERVMSAQ